MRHKFFNLSFTLLLLITSCRSADNWTQQNAQMQYSGIYPHLAYYNNESECGTGAVVPWADRLWVITYGPHLPYGSSDKLYEITSGLEMTTRRESIGGTPANRMIHPESNQLFIGPYAIDSIRNVRVIPYAHAPGRYTGLARHLTDPENKIYIATMEEGFYEVDVHRLQVSMLHEDGNVKNKKGDDISVNQPGSLLPGAHGKGAYSGQGVLVYSNNGEAVPEALTQFDIPSGALAEWDGDKWTVVRRNQFVEVTGPGGLYGNKNAVTDPIWATGWDHKSILVGVRDRGRWSFYRLPKASHSYDGAHGWNTEWPRIRDIGTAERPDYLMTMHGMFWRFPGKFSSQNAAGIRPRASYLKVIGDFARWGDQLVFGSDDSAQKEFLNRRKVKGGIEGPGQSNSNLWFTSIDMPDHLGPTTATGSVWAHDSVAIGEPSEPFLFAGWPRRSAWIKNEGLKTAGFSFETSPDGRAPWTLLRRVVVPPGETLRLSFSAQDQGEWIRAVADQSTTATVHFSYSDEDERDTTADDIFTGLSGVADPVSSGGLLYGLGNDRRALGMYATNFSGDKQNAADYYELGADMKLVRKDNRETARFIREKFAIQTKGVTFDEASVLVVDDSGRRWRLPLGADAFTRHTQNGMLRIAREVATERDLFNCHGTFYELPAENADGFAKIRPIASHGFRIHDYASYRGMLIMSGIEPVEGENNPQVIISEDGRAALWAGVIDDLWKLGKPRGRGGPWRNTLVKGDTPSDPYLIGFYDRRTLTLSHTRNESVTFRIEVQPVGHGSWMLYQKVQVNAGESFQHVFPDDFHARWIRFTADRDTRATAWLNYE